MSFDSDKLKESLTKFNNTLVNEHRDNLIKDIKNHQTFIKTIMTHLEKDNPYRKIIEHNPTELVTTQIDELEAYAKLIFIKPELKNQPITEKIMNQLKIFSKMKIVKQHVRQIIQMQTGTNDNFDRVNYIMHHYWAHITENKPFKIISDPKKRKYWEPLYGDDQLWGEYLDTVLKNSYHTTRNSLLLEIKNMSKLIMSKGHPQN